VQLACAESRAFNIIFAPLIESRGYLSEMSSPPEGEKQIRKKKEKTGTKKKKDRSEKKERKEKKEKDEKKKKTKK